MTSASVLFFSSSPIALPLLEELAKDERFKIVGLVCAPDKPADRGQQFKTSNIKEAALKKGIPVFQPTFLSKDLELLEKFKSDRPDFLLSFAYGQILNESWLALPKREPLNVHPSLLPKYRGPTPIEGALLAGEKETGITLMKMVRAMDAGPIGFQHAFTLDENTVSGELFKTVAKKAAELLPDDINTIAQNSSFVFKEQNENEVSFTKKLAKDDAYEDFSKDGEQILCRYRAFTPTPGLWSQWQNKRIKFHKLLRSNESIEPGKVLLKNKGLYIGTQSFAVEILELQLEGKKTLPVNEFLKGVPDFAKATIPS